MLEGRPAESGRPVLRRVALPGFRFALRYTHSVLGVPVEERFTVSGRGRLVLEEIRSTDEAIVAYYGLTDAIAQGGTGDVRLAGLHRPFARLRLRASAAGDRTYLDAGCRLPLARLAGEAGALELRVRLRPAAAALWPFREDPCRSGRAPR